MGMSNLDSPFSTIKTDIDNIKNIENDEKNNENIEKIFTPGWKFSNTPQKRLISRNHENLENYYPHHQQLEIIEKRIRSGIIETTTTDSVVDCYELFGQVDILSTEKIIVDSYKFIPYDSFVPKFWETRVYDLNSQKIDEENSQMLEKEIEKSLTIHFSESKPRNQWKKTEKILAQLEKQEEKTQNNRKRIISRYEISEKNIKKGKHSLKIPNPPESSKFLFIWEKNWNSTDDSNNDTDPDDFVL